MQVEFVSIAGEQDEVLMSAPFDSGQPMVGDVLTIHLPDGKALFKVYERNWMFSQFQDEDGKNRVSGKLICFVTPVGMFENEKDEETTTE